MSWRTITPSKRFSMWFSGGLLSLVVGLTGCNYFVGLGYLIGGPPSITPAYEKATKQSMTDYGVKVAVICYAPKDVKIDFATVDQDLGRMVSLKLAQKQVQVIQPDRVLAWLDQNPDWDKPEEIGEAFDATHVVYIDMHKFSLWEENSQQLYRGRTEAVISVYEMDDDGYGEKIFSKELNEMYPRQVARDASEVNFTTFQREYLYYLAEQIGLLFYPGYAGDNVGNAT